LGGGLLVLAAKPLLDVDRRVRPWAVAALAVAGSAAWMLGVYQKETSICVLPLLAGVLIAGRAHLASWPRLSRARKSVLGVLAAVVLLPLVHVAVETARIRLRGDLVYDAQAGSGRGLVDGVRELYDWAHEAMPPSARLLIWAALVVTVVATVLRRRVDPIAVGALLSGLLSFLFAGQSGVVATRYYIPILALFAVAFALSLARLPDPVQLAGVLAVALAFLPAPETRAEVRAWTDEELGNQALVQQVGRLEGSGCVVAAAGLDAETKEALPVLVGLERASRPGLCEGGETHLVTGVGSAEEDEALTSVCVPGSLELLTDAHIGSLYRCGRLRAEPVHDPELGVVDPERLVAARRLESGAAS
jgi:hypothetical protein